MNYRGRSLLVVDFIMLLLSIIGIIDYTFLYIVIHSSYRYLFIFCNVMAVLVIIDAVKSITYYYKLRKIKKNKKARVNGHLFYDRERKVKKVIE